MILVLAAVLSLGSLPQVTNIDAVVRQLPSLQAVAGSLGGGHVQIQIIVDPTGKPLLCRVVASSGWPSLDLVSCQLFMKEAQFKPGRDEEGQSIFGVVRKFFDYRPPGSRSIYKASTDYTLFVSKIPPAAKDHFSILRVITDATGKLESCFVKTSSGVVQLDQLACESIRGNGALLPVLDGKGAPVRAVRVVTVGFASGPAR